MLTTLMIAATLLAPAPQEPTPAPEGSARVEALRARIHDMRMNLLLGGEQVVRAENEAVDFYRRKAELIEQRHDTVQVDLSEKRATYAVTVDQALGGASAEAREAATAKALALRSEMVSLEREAAGLGDKRGNLSKLIRTVESRARERESLATQVETSGDFDAEGFGLPLGGIGLAPAVAIQPAGSPFDDEGLIADLLERNPRGARRLLFESDAARYWKRFPLQPPAEVLPRAIPLPLPDLPGSR